MCSFGFIALVLSCSPQGLAVACGIQSLDQESSEFFFYWNKVDLQHCVCCRCTRSCPVICVCHHLQICFRGINVYTLNICKTDRQRDLRLSVLHMLVCVC